MTRAVKALFILAGAVAQAAGAGELVKGLSLGQSETSTAEVEDDLGGSLQLRQRLSRREINLMTPLAEELSYGRWLLKLDAYRDQRDLSERDAGRYAPLLNHNDLLSLGLVWLSPSPLENVQPIVLFNYMSNETLHDRPLREYIVGADVKWFGGTSRLLVRDRAFPGFSEWLVLAGYRRKFVSQFGMDILLPAYVFFYYETPDYAWRFQTGLQWQSREYPVNDAGRQAWWSGYAEKAVISVRAELAKPLYASLEGGVFRERLKLKDGTGTEQEKLASRAAPFVRFALEGWFESQR